MAKKNTSKCLSCNEAFTADVRNRGRQKYCGKPECRRAAKGARRDLIGVGLLAYRRPLYQVLALDRPAPPPARELGVQPLQRSLHRVQAQLERSAPRTPVPSSNTPRPQRP